jgi:branched-chain amino acid transport system substrate-binding protein
MEATTMALEAVSRIGADNINTVAGVNPGYSFGEDEQAVFSQAIQGLTGASVVYEGFPDLGSSDFSTQISRINQESPDIVFSSLWGGDASTFLQQATSRNMFENIEAIFGPVFYGSADALTEGVVSPNQGQIFAGSRNFYWDAPDTGRAPGSQALFETAQSQSDITVPTAHWMSGYGAVMSWATAVEKAIDTLGGDTYPSQRQIAAALEGHGFYSGGGYHVMSEDHQGRSNSYAGELAWDSDLGAPVINDVNVFSAQSVSPPPQGSAYEVTATDWLAGWTN